MIRSSGLLFGMCWVTPLSIPQASESAEQAVWYHEPRDRVVKLVRLSIQHGVITYRIFRTFGIDGFF